MLLFIGIIIGFLFATILKKFEVWNYQDLYKKYGAWWLT